MACNPIEERAVAEYLPNPEGEEPAQDPVESRPSYLITNLPDDLAISRTPDTVQTRNRLALVCYLGYWIVSVLVVVGGLTGRFAEQLVGAVVAGLGASAAAVAYFYFRRPGQ
ncbi:hypothetical protein [Plantactinospora sp. WMMB782]|uniref:hypothetical protein n=1 Tax=Plantactinospora sp. WMMB782 TaxID=3404121 RepID=UPI003B928B9F